MPVHDWTRVDSGLFHAFHQYWIPALCTALNGGVLPDDYFALPEQNIAGPIPDGLAVATAPPQARVIRRSETDLYAQRADRIAVRHRHGDIVAVIEIMSPGNKGSRAVFSAFVKKSVELLRQHVHLLIVDLFPHTRRDPQGIHKAIWDEFIEEDFDLPSQQPLTIVSYDAGPPWVAYIESIAVGDALPTLPLFLRPEVYVPTPLEATYAGSWSVFPAAMKKLLE